MPGQIEETQIQEQLMLQEAAFATLSRHLVLSYTQRRGDDDALAPGRRLRN